jgi:AraC family transcriptional regulator
VLSPPKILLLDRHEYDGIRFEEQRVGADSGLDWHQHEETFIDFHLDGFSKASWSDSVHAHTVTIMPAGEPHRSLTLSDIHTLQVVIPQTHTARLAGAALCGQISFCDGGLATHQAHALYRAFLSRDDLSELDFDGVLADILAANQLEAGSDSRWLGTARDYLRDNRARSISSSELALAVAIDPSHMMRQFRKAFRCTIGEYVRSLRVQEACRLLRSSRLTCTEIAFQVGFADQSHFNRSFKNRLGVTPSAYLEQVRIDRS